MVKSGLSNDSLQAKQNGFKLDYMVDFEQIRLCFKHRDKPMIIVGSTFGDSLEIDARYFENLNWEQVTTADWQGYSDAFCGMTAEAFCYFLPSILSLSLNGLSDAPMVADYLADLLDTSGDPDLWDGFFLERFQLLVPDELIVLENWVRLQIIKAGDDQYDLSRLERALSTVETLRIVNG